MHFVFHFRLSSKDACLDSSAFLPCYALFTANLGRFARLRVVDADSKGMHPAVGTETLVLHPWTIPMSSLLFHHLACPIHSLVTGYSLHLWYSM